MTHELAARFALAALGVYAAELATLFLVETVGRRLLARFRFALRHKERFS